jgi:tetratricopeptide (TPR) repeat protein
MPRTIHVAASSLVFIAAAGVGLLAHNGGPIPPASPEVLATRAFNSGVKHLDNGDRSELKAASEKAGKIAKALQRAREEYEKALKDFTQAVDLLPSMYRAFNGLGYAYRKTGDYTRALENYDQALKLSPDFADAIEYRGEADLGLNRTEDAKQAYLKLFASDRRHADMLMKAMKAWVEQRHADPAGVDPSALTTFEGWIGERADLAQRTITMARDSPQAGWR